VVKPFKNGKEIKKSWYCVFFRLKAEEKLLYELKRHEEM
jgi:hypothetical protein